MAERFLGRDWRSPGEQWVHTASGWKRLLEMSSDGCERTEKDATGHASTPALLLETGTRPSVVEETVDDDDTLSGDSYQHKNTERLVTRWLKVEIYTEHSYACDEWCVLFEMHARGSHKIVDWWKWSLIVWYVTSKIFWSLNFLAFSWPRLFRFWELIHWCFGTRILSCSFDCLVSPKNYVEHLIPFLLHFVSILIPFWFHFDPILIPSTNVSTSNESTAWCAVVGVCVVWHIGSSATIEACMVTVYWWW